MTSIRCIARESSDRHICSSTQTTEKGKSSRRPGGSSNSSGLDLTPLSASSYFTQALEVSPADSTLTFRAYYSPPRPASSSSSSESHKRGSVVVCHHGAGSGGTTFAALAKQVSERSGGELGSLAFDARGHGEHISSGRLARAVTNVCYRTFVSRTPQARLVRKVTPMQTSQLKATTLSCHSTTCKAILWRSSPRFSQRLPNVQTW